MTLCKPCLADLLSTGKRATDSSDTSCRPHSAPRKNRELASSVGTFFLETHSRVFLVFFLCAHLISFCLFLPAGIGQTTYSARSRLALVLPSPLLRYLQSSITSQAMQTPNNNQNTQEHRDYTNIGAILMWVGAFVLCALIAVFYY